MTDNGVLLRVENLKTHFATQAGVLRAVDGVDLELSRGEALGIVGETGCGKSVFALSLLRIVPSPPGNIVAGKVLFDGQDLLQLPEEAMRRIRGRRISMIFQEPMTSINPVFRVGEQIVDVIRLHQGIDRRQATEIAAEMLKSVRIPDHRKVLRSYPHELSGGMRQRVMIAMALSCRPGLLIADEPTTALDVSIQAQILYLIAEMRRGTGTSVLLISHDLGVVAQVCDSVAVMYAGLVVEKARVQDIFDDPRHPYTRGLLGSLPRLDVERQRLETIPGIVPDLRLPPPGCRFHPRCGEGRESCRDSIPHRVKVADGHDVACFMYE